MLKIKSIQLLVLCSAFFAAACATNTQEKSGSDWLTLFNGVDLTGWVKKGGAATYEVVDGMIVGTTVSGTPNTFLATIDLYSDFILEFEFNIDSAMNSGVQFRSNSLPDYKDGEVHGYQFELDPSPRSWTAGIYDESRRGWLYPMDVNPGAQQQIEGRKWYKARIECIGNDIRTFLNDIPASHLIDVKAIPQSGFVALQVHSIKPEEQAGKKIMWRNIRITDNIAKYRSRSDSDIFVKDLSTSQE